jgi:hypothetical protein
MALVDREIFPITSGIIPDTGMDSRSKNVAPPIVIRRFASLLAIPLLACQHAPPYLPSHPISEMFPRASSPPPTCPGQYRLTIEDASGDVFLGCWGQNGG